MELERILRPQNERQQADAKWRQAVINLDTD